MNKMYFDIKGASDMKTLVSILVINGYKVTVTHEMNELSLIETYRIEVEVEDD